ncbi:MAG: alpha/beta hydrolase [Mycobacterium sp.]
MRPSRSAGTRTAAVKPDFRDRMQKVTGRPALQAIARMPDSIKRLLLGGRSITIDGNTLDTTLQLALALQRISGREGLILSDDAATARVRLDLRASQFPQSKVDVTVTDVSVPGPGGDIPAVHIRSTNDDGAPMLVFYHGGGFVVGGYETHGHLCEVICQRAGVHVLFVDYRRAPEHAAPAAADDAYAAYLWAREHAAELGADPARVAVGGDSAGGNLTAVVSQRARNEGAQPPVLQLLLYPITNFASHTRSYGLFADGFFLRRRDMDLSHGKYLDGSGIDPADPRVSPLLADDLSGLPPAILVTAGFDPLRDEGRQYAEALRAAGTPVDAREYGSMIHAFPNFFTLGGGSATATDDIISALRAHLSRS